MGNEIIVDKKDYIEKLMHSNKLAEKYFRTEFRKVSKEKEYYESINDVNKINELTEKKNELEGHIHAMKNTNQYLESILNTGMF